MNRYTIFCTESQTRKALELGAPIEKLANHPIDKEICDKYHFLVIDGVCYNNPTAEQMIGFFRSKNIHIVIHKDVVDKWSVYGHEIEPIEFTVFDRLTGYNSFKEAIFAAIDAALEYLSNKEDL